jgi:hypothetical protein
MEYSRHAGRETLISERIGYSAGYICGWMWFTLKDTWVMDEAMNGK